MAGVGRLVSGGGGAEWYEVGGGAIVGGGTVNLWGTEGGGTLWSSAGFGLRLGEQVELVDIGL